MQKFIRKAILGSLLSLFIFSFCEQGYAVNAGFGSSRLITANQGTGPGSLIATWLETDENGFNHVIGATGATDSTIINAIDISSEIISAGGANFSPPVLSVNKFGDAIVVWEYTDLNGNGYVAGCTLPFGSSVWNFNQGNPISLNVENAAFYDERAQIDDNGNLFVTWTSNLDGNNFVRGATGAIGTTTLFNSPFTLSTQ